MTGSFAFSTLASINDIIGARTELVGSVVAEDGAAQNGHSLASPAKLERRLDVWSFVSSPCITEALTEGTADEALAQACKIASLGDGDRTYGAMPCTSAESVPVLQAALDQRRGSAQETSQSDESTTQCYRLFEVDVGVAAVEIPYWMGYVSAFGYDRTCHTSPSVDYTGLFELASNRLRLVSNRQIGVRAPLRRHYNTRSVPPPRCCHPKLVLLLRDNGSLVFADGLFHRSMYSTHLVVPSLCNVPFSRTRIHFVQPRVVPFTCVTLLLLPTIPVVGNISRRSTAQRVETANENNSVRSISRQAESLQRRVKDQIESFGFHKRADGACDVYVDDKERIRNLHGSQRLERLSANAEFLSRRSSNLLRHFASGQEIDVAQIEPELERVYAGTWQADLFRMASLTWSVPVSNGFGRRLRYLVWDMHNKKLLGLIAIGDPVFNLSVRDTLIGWDATDRRDRLVNIMDAYVLGAMPPYNTLLAGKLVACLVRSRQIYDEFSCTYGDTVGIISGKAKQPRLLTVTTSSSMGRSSVYNRLRLDGVQYFEPIGYTRGWGHFHIPEDLFLELRDYLRGIGHEYADQHRFGQGPNWRLRTTRAALEALGFRDEPLRHGIRRQVFVCNLASNAANILRTGKGSPDLSGLLTVRQIADLALKRWILPRASRRLEYRAWDRSGVLKLLGDRVPTSRTRSQRLNPTLGLAQE